MRLNMNNHYGSNSVTADIEHTKDDIELKIIKNKALVSKRIYFRFQLQSGKNRANLLLNTEQLEAIAKHLNEYVENNNHKKRSNAKASKVEVLI